MFFIQCPLSSFNYPDFDKWEPAINMRLKLNFSRPLQSIFKIVLELSGKVLGSAKGSIDATETGQSSAAVPSVKTVRFFNTNIRKHLKI